MRVWIFCLFGWFIFKKVSHVSQASQELALLTQDGLELLIPTPRFTSQSAGMADELHCMA